MCCWDLDISRQNWAALHWVRSSALVLPSCHESCSLHSLVLVKVRKSLGLHHSDGYVL